MESGEKSSSATNKGEATDFEELRERFTVIESKLEIVDDIFGIRQPTEDTEEEESDSDVALSDAEGFTSQEFLKDAFYYLHRIRVSHEKLRAQNRRAREFRRSQRSEHDEQYEQQSARDISTAAFLEREPATIIWVDWQHFLYTKGDPETSLMTPISVAISEPEAHLLPRTPITKLEDANSTLENEYSNAQAPDKSTRASSLGQVPLPERVKIHSDPLRHLFCEHFNIRPGWGSHNDRAIVFLRPYREFIYYEKKLRESLDKLEERFKNWDGKSHLEAIGDADTRPQPAGETVTEYLADRVKDSITALLHLRCLINFIDGEIKPRLDYIGGSQCHSILFNDLWHLFKPGDEVIDQTEKQAYRIIRVQIPKHRFEVPWMRWRRRREVEKADEDETPVVVHCAYIDFDGKKLGPVSVTFRIPSYGGLKDIKSLPIYPLRLSKDTKLRDNLIARGKMLLNITKFKPMYYVGLTIDTRDEIDSQVVVDFSEALADEERRNWTPSIESLHTGSDIIPGIVPCGGPCCIGQSLRYDEHIDSRLTEDFVKSLVPDASLHTPSLILSPRSLEEVISNNEDGPTNEELVVMTYRAFGFVLRTRKWAKLDLTFLKYENTDARNSARNAFERLELPGGHRQMVKSLVTQHFRGRQATLARDEQTDLVRGKGKGLILLLHGAPGVGKTTTAEGVAELFEKPLFQITCGDLGTTARDVEQELEKNFALASRWGCILLLDEADVFLSARERKDFERNGLVAVFLRVLEYYTGILFLTTNRIGDFDEAFASRIHMSLYYPELDEDKTKKVFKLNLNLIQERFDRQGRKIMYDVSSIEDFAEQHFRNYTYNRWNGRQIRNACQTALALAEFDAHGGKVHGEIDTETAVELQLKHFRLVQTAYLDFGTYLGDIRGTKGDRRAFDYGLRAKSDTPYQTTPSRFSAASMQDSRHTSSLSHEYNNNYDNRYPPQGGQGSDPFQPIVSHNRVSGGSVRGGYGAGGSPGMGHQMYGQYNTQQGQMGSGDGYRGYDGPRDHGYTHPGNQPGQADSRLYQQSNQPNQNLGTFGPSMNQGYPPGGPPQYGQGYHQGLQGQNPQGQQHQGQTQYSQGGLGGGPEGGISGSGGLGN
ncbi:hypothetical protein GGR51DRAFT_351928 [Nemania sp. FL0031]|nr:hypothetical protein GGR51DRAFT_351928 [Nemania sp. FL0031]